MIHYWHIWLLTFCLLSRAEGADLSLPARPADAPKGSEFAKAITGLDRVLREAKVREQVLSGNVPDFWRRFAEVEISRKIDGQLHQLTFRVAPEYLAIGSDADYFLMPVSPALAQDLADHLGCVLPTRLIVDDIYAAATLKLAPEPIPPSTAMTSVPVF